MATNLVEIIQKNLDYPELQKIDPNTQAVRQDKTTTDPNNVGQAAIPAVLIGLYKYGNTERGSENILRGDVPSSWLDLFFMEKKSEIISAVASYSGTSVELAAADMEEIALEAVKIIRQQRSENASSATVKTYVAEQRNSILVYLPAELQISSIIDDNTLDDRTNKMEGPISNSMHFLEKLFSGSTTEKNEVTEDNKKTQ